MKFDYGDEVMVLIRNDAGNGVEQRGVVVGITPVEREEQEKAFKYPVGTIFYTVEFGDGTDALVSESGLRLAN